VGIDDDGEGAEIEQHVWDIVFTSLESAVEFLECVRGICGERLKDDGSFSLHHVEGNENAGPSSAANTGVVFITGDD
jgi:hypothetical protein